MVALATALMAGGCGTRANPHSGAGLDAPPAEGGIETAAPAAPRPEPQTGPETEPTDAPPVRWPLAWETVRALPSCGTHEPVRIQRDGHRVPLDFALSAERERPDAHYAAFVGTGPDRDAGNAGTPWTRIDLRTDGSSVTGVVDCRRCGASLCVFNDELHYVALGFDAAGEPICAWTNDGAAFVVAFHALAEAVPAVDPRGFPGACDPEGAIGRLPGLEPDDRIEVHGVVRCSECDSPYVRVRIARTSDDYGLVWVDVLADREFTARIPPGSTLSLEATEVLGTLTGRVDGVEIREGMEPIEIRIEGGAVDSGPFRPAGRLLLPPGAEFRRDLGGASTMNPGMNRSDHVYAVPGTLDEVEVFYRETLGIEPSRSAGQITFPLGDLGRRDSDLPGAERTLVIRQEGDQVFVHVRCRGCY